MIRSTTVGSLATDLYLPPGPAPVVVTRTPYDRAGLRAEGRGWARHGIAFVAQDVRGRYGSPGEWVPYRRERADGAALVEWVRAQPWCDGRVAVCGASYAAFTAWAAAVSTPVDAVLSQVPAMGTDRVAWEPSGILRLSEHVAWWSEHADARTSRTGLVAAMLTEAPGLLAHLPVRDLPAVLWPDLPGWWSAVEAGPGPEAVTDAELAALTVPTLHVGGWYDLLLPETLHQWRTVGGSLLVGPWGHELCLPGRTAVGDREHGPGSQVPLGPRQVEWLRAALAGAPATTRVFRLGDGAWLDRWPAAGGRDWTPAPAGVRWWHRPADPVPSVLPGHDRSGLDGRADQVRLTGAPLTAPQRLGGVPRLSVDHGAGDLVVRLVERLADGRALELTRGSARGPGTEVVLDPVVAVLAPGSRIELALAATDFPRLARDLGPGWDPLHDKETTAVERVLPGPLTVRLPVQEDT